MDTKLSSGFLPTSALCNPSLNFCRMITSCAIHIHAWADVFSIGPSQVVSTAHHIFDRGEMTRRFRDLLHRHAHTFMPSPSCTRHHTHPPLRAAFSAECDLYMSAHKRTRVEQPTSQLCATPEFKPLLASKVALRRCVFAGDRSLTWLKRSFCQCARVSLRNPVSQMTLIVHQ